MTERHEEEMSAIDNYALSWQYDIRSSHPTLSVGLNTMLHMYTA